MIWPSPCHCGGSQDLPTAPGVSKGSQAHLGSHLHFFFFLIFMQPKRASLMDLMGEFQDSHTCLPQGLPDPTFFPFFLVIFPPLAAGRPSLGWTRGARPPSWAGFRQRSRSCVFLSPGADAAPVHGRKAGRGQGHAGHFSGSLGSWTRSHRVTLNSGYCR